MTTLFIFIVGITTMVIGIVVGIRLGNKSGDTFSDLELVKSDFEKYVHFISNVFLQLHSKYRDDELLCEIMRTRPNELKAMILHQLKDEKLIASYSRIREVDNEKIDVKIHGIIGNLENSYDEYIEYRNKTR